MKDRYYTICRKLARTRTASDAQSQQQLIQSHSFDKGEIMLGAPADDELER
jgi:DNA methyltransferase 1-associated protein 1